LTVSTIRDWKVNQLAGAGYYAISPHANGLRNKFAIFNYRTCNFKELLVKIAFLGDHVP